MTVDPLLAERVSDESGNFGDVVNDLKNISVSWIVSTSIHRLTKLKVSSDRNTTWACTVSVIS